MPFYIPFEVAVRSGIEHLSVGPSHKLGDKCDRLHICSRKTHNDCKIKNKKCIHQTFIRIYFVLRLKFLNLTIKDKAEKTKTVLRQF